MTDQQNFFSDESGAVTVDWVVLTAALVGLGLAVMTVISGGLETISGNIDDTLERDDLIRVSFANQFGGGLSAADQDQIRADARGLQNDALGASYAAALGDADIARQDLDALGFGDDPNAYADQDAFIAANTTFDTDGTTILSQPDAGDYANFTSAASNLNQANQRANLVQDEGTQRGLSWNGSAFE